MSSSIVGVGRLTLDFGRWTFGLGVGRFGFGVGRLHFGFVYGRQWRWRWRWMFGFGVGRLDFIVNLTSTLDVWLWELFGPRWDFCVWSFAFGLLA